MKQQRETYQGNKQHNAYIHESIPRTRAYAIATPRPKLQTKTTTTGTPTLHQPRHEGFDVRNVPGSQRAACGARGMGFLTTKIPTKNPERKYLRNPMDYKWFPRADMLAYADWSRNVTEPHPITQTGIRGPPAQAYEQTQTKRTPSNKYNIYQVFVCTYANTKNPICRRAPERFAIINAHKARGTCRTNRPLNYDITTLSVHKTKIHGRVAPKSAARCRHVFESGNSKGAKNLPKVAPWFLNVYYPLPKMTQQGPRCRRNCTIRCWERVVLTR